MSAVKPYRLTMLVFTRLSLSSSLTTETFPPAQACKNAVGPYVKLIITLRDPIERAISHYKMRKFKNAITLDIDNFYDLGCQWLRDLL